MLCVISGLFRSRLLGVSDLRGSLRKLLDRKLPQLRPDSECRVGCCMTRATETHHPQLEIRPLPGCPIFAAGIWGTAMLEIRVSDPSRFFQPSQGLHRPAALGQGNMAGFVATRVDAAWPPKYRCAPHALSDTLLCAGGRGRRGMVRGLHCTVGRWGPMRTYGPTINSTERAVKKKPCPLRCLLFARFFGPWLSSKDSWSASAAAQI